MSTMSLDDAETTLSSLVDDASRGEIVTITRLGTPVAAIVSLEAAELARKMLGTTKPSLVTYLCSFPGGDVGCDRSPSRDADV